MRRSGKALFTAVAVTAGWRAGTPAPQWVSAPVALYTSLGAQTQPSFEPAASGESAESYGGSRVGFGIRAPLPAAVAAAPPVPECVFDADGADGAALSGGGDRVGRVAVFETRTFFGELTPAAQALERAPEPQRAAALAAAMAAAPAAAAPAPGSRLFDTPTVIILPKGAAAEGGAEPAPDAEPAAEAGSPAGAWAGAFAASPAVDLPDADTSLAAAECWPGRPLNSAGVGGGVPRNEVLSYEAVDFEGELVGAEKDGDGDGEFWLWEGGGQRLRPVPPPGAPSAAWPLHRPAVGVLDPRFYQSPLLTPRLPAVPGPRRYEVHPGGLETLRLANGEERIISTTPHRGNVLLMHDITGYLRG